MIARASRLSPMAPVLAVLGLCGCTFMPQYERPAAPIPSEFPHVTDTAAHPPAQLSWRDFVRDERLARLIELALANNRDLRVALLNVEQSRAQYRITRSDALPRIDASGGFTRQHARGLTSNQENLSVGLTAYELDLFGRVRSLTRQALEQYLATEQAGRSARIALIAEVATQYFELRAAQEQLGLAKQTLTVVQDSYDLNQTMFDAGAVAELDLRSAQGQLQTARINVLTYERQSAQAENALALLLGAALPADLPAPRPFGSPDLLAQVPAGLPSELVQRRPDILQAEHTLKSANANVGAARAAFFPTISLTGSVGRASSELSQLFGSGSGVWSFSPQIAVPLFTGGANSANLEAAKVGVSIDVAGYEEAIQTAFREVADALVGVDSYASQIAAEEQAIDAQSRRFELATLRYRQGEDTYLNMLLAQQDLYSAQQGRLQAQLNQLSSQISLFQALGGDWQP